VATISPLDSELLIVASLPLVVFSTETLPLLRTSYAEMARQTMTDPSAGVRRAERYIPIPESNGDVSLLVYSPSATRSGRPVLLHIHGGGYALGLPEMSDARNIRLAEDLGCVVVSVDYRPAPDAPYPAALDDCYAALRWIPANAAEVGVDPMRIILIGESAGGGLAAALLLRARD